jgi:MFS family permease
VVPWRLDPFPPELRPALRIDIAGAVLVAAFSSLTVPFTGLILRRELGATPLQLSLMASAGAAFMLASLLWVRLLRGRSALACVVWAGFVGRGLFLLVPLVGSAWGLVAILVGASVMATASAPAATALVERLYPAPLRGRAVGAVKTAGALAGIVLALGAGALLARVDYRWTFAAAAVLGMAASLVLRRLPVPATAEALAPPHSPGAPWRVLREDARFRGLMLTAAIFGTAIWLQMPAHPVLMADVLHVGAGQAGVLAAAASVAALGGAALWGRLADRRGTLRALRLVYVLGAVGPLVGLTAASAGLLVVSAATDALMHGGLDIVMTLAVIEAAGRRRVADYAAIAATLGGLRGVVAPLAGGALIHHAGVHAVYAVAAALMAAAIAIVSWQIRRATAAAAPAPAAVAA